MKRQCIFVLIFLILSIEQVVSAENWIVVTTIQHPTEALIKIRDYARDNDWKLLVVGDKKTPKNWVLDGAIFLSSEDQQSLGYEICQLLPWNHYCRKNIGYLYAIENGAKYIYETDDDNYLTSPITPLKDEDEIICLDSDHRCVNIYAYFGQKSVWPRGFPLQEVKAGCNFQAYKTQGCKIGVEQGLVNKEPDVDAIFRLTQEREVYFEDRPPCVLQKGIYCPFNTQNTLFHYQAFWGLYIPATTSFRSCDIWRGYITQFLMWMTNYHLCFLAPNAVQERNPHDYLKDFSGEMELYLKAGSLIDDLENWDNPSTSFDAKMIALYDHLMEKAYFTSSETQLIRAWISDLKKVGYRFPDLKH